MSVPWQMKQPQSPPRIYFSGFRTWSRGEGQTRAGELEIGQRTGWRYRCYSYYHLRKDREHLDAVHTFLSHPESRILLDSGAFTFLAGFHGRAKIEDSVLQAYIEQYAAFYHDLASRHPGQIDIVATFDYVRHAPTVYEMTKRLWKLGVPAMPVYHGDTEIDFLKRYLDAGVTYIGLGKPVRVQMGGAYLRKIFYDPAFEFAAKHRVLLHGFGETGQNMAVYPWTSLDSSSWLAAAVNGNVFIVRSSDRSLARVRLGTRRRDGTLSIYHLPKGVRREWESQVREFGYDPTALPHIEFERASYNVSWMIRYASMKRIPRANSWRSIL